MAGSFRAAARLLVFAAVTLPLMPLQQIFIWFWPAMTRRLPHVYHRMLCQILGVTVQVSGMAPQQGPCLIVANHVSWLDIVVLSSVMPCSFIAKREVGTWPLFGSLARLQRTVFVDRQRRHATANVRDGIAERLNAGEILVLFPEGTSGDGNSVRPFKSSFFAAAKETAEVIPVTISYLTQWNLPLTSRQRPSVAWYGDMDMAPHLWAALKAGPVCARVTIDQAIAAKDRKHAAGLAEQMIRDRLATTLHGPRDLL